MPALSFGTWDIFLLLALVGLQIALGIWVSLRQKGADDYFMAGHTLSWWQVGGSVFSTNISATHLIGMLGIGYSVGFAQSHYEILAVFPILLLVFVFVPIYRRLQVFTLSQFLEKRFGERVRLLYAVFMLLLILVQLVGQFYIGARAISLITQGSALNISYPWALLLLVGLTCSYTFFGGLKAVVVTDTVQGVFILFVSFLLCYFALSQPEIGGLTGLMHIDAVQPIPQQRMHLYLPAHHDSLPFTGVFTGLMLLHTFYWVTNQYLVQRVIAARSLRDAQIGALTAGFLKLCIPFTCILTGIAAAHLFDARFPHTSPPPDDAFVYLVYSVVPQGVGWTGILFAGVAASIFSTLDSMLNSATTLLSIDIYRPYIRPSADDRHLVRFGRASILFVSLLTAALAYLTYDPSAGGNFFLRVSAYGSYITPGIIAVFFAAVAVRGIPWWGAFFAILVGPLAGWFAEWGYSNLAANDEWLSAWLGIRLNFLHRVLLSFTCSAMVLWLSRVVRKQNVMGESDAEGILLTPAQRTSLSRITSVFLTAHLMVVWLIDATPQNAANWSTPMAVFSAFFLERALAARGVEPLIRYLSALLVASVVFMLYFFV
jgi:SSS family solute:Na+ symporter